MPFLLQSWDLLLAALCSMVNQRQLQTIEFQNAQTEALLRKSGKKRLLLDDDRRRLPAVKSYVIGCKILPELTTTFTPELHHPDACCRNVRSVFCRVLLVEVETKQVASHTDKLDFDFTGPGDVPVAEVKVNQHCGSGILIGFQHTAVVDGNR